MQNVIVLKFGSSVLRSADDLPNVVHEIYRWYREGYAVIAVVSAIGKTTESLLRESRTLTESPEPFSTAELLATGERTSAALLGIALDRSGVPSRVVNPREIGFEVTGAPLDSEPVSLDTARVHELLAEHSVLVVPGFFGTDRAGRTHLLGRGGSDLTAVFLAVELKARCRLLKDVDGVYESDPADPQAHPRRFAQLHYQDALRVAGKLIQPKAVSRLAKLHANCEVAALALPYATLVHGGATAHATSSHRRTPTDVVILGCGIVGFGVYQRLCANADLYRVIGILVRDSAKHEDAGVPAALLHTQAETLKKLTPKLAIDALPGIEPSHEWVTHYLSEGVDVISANKAVIAQFGCVLAEIAQKSGATLRYCAAVGGAGPMLEAVDRARQRGNIRSLVGVLNGTCNFLLDACAAGESLHSAIKEAQRLGFAEADPTEDICGRDVVRKSRILARHAFGVEVKATELHVFGEAVVEAARAAAQGRRLRQLARATMRDGELVLSVSFESVSRESPFYSLSGEWNALAVTLADGEALTLSGRGAGRWPTTEAVMADVFEASRFRLHLKNQHECIPTARLASA